MTAALYLRIEMLGGGQKQAYLWFFVHYRPVPDIGYFGTTTLLT